MLIRDYQPADRDAVAAIALAAFAQYRHDYDDWPTFSAGVAAMPDLARDAELIVAGHQGALVGAVAHVPPGSPRSSIFPSEWSVIRMLVVDPQQRSLGIGKHLVAACLERAGRLQAPRIGLHTSPIMAHALALYSSLGFERDCDLAPNRGVPYGRYSLPGAAIPAALATIHASMSRARVPSS